ncbi:alpha/beta fold hydrolase [Cellulosimicrobium arenosum]|uniref:Alpha/beta fold hydrolase n=1 Tax=Cellulosimicrobium arenosum TaxID=2708133 RepID=A0A927PEU9_9MICO|nr:alpha/beta fold hydrolase [Cellulosimicrobium arenosum]MBD8080011.1 alpha/beta fold hydrolase [Cellulosimicrobium arenosum]
MSRTISHRSLALPLSALALLALTAGTVTACTGPGAASESAASQSASHETGQPVEATRHMIDNDGHHLAFYVTEGTGPTVVLDSGGGEDSSYWKDLVPELHEATGATVITYDRAGLGQSEVVPGPWQVESAVSDLESGLEQLGVTDDVTLVSHSQAGQIATYLAQDNPALLSGAVLVDANLPPFFTDEQIERLVAFSQPQLDAAQEDPDNPQNRQLLSTAESFVATSTAFHQATWPDAVPATVIVSEKTPFDGSPEDVQRWKDAAASFVQDGPRRTLVTADGSSHDVAKDRPDLVLEEIENMVAAQH